VAYDLAMANSNVRSYAAQSASSPLAPFTIPRRAPGARDVEIDILFCGVCHSDLHQARDEWHNTTYPCVPGHEIVGTVTRVGPEVTKFKVGDRAGVGCMVGSCGTCTSCTAGHEQYCTNTVVFTYNSDDTVLGGKTYGGYSSSIVVDQSFVLQIPKTLDLAAAAPLLCAGITTYSPLRRWKAGPGQKVGIVGLGGLGHMGVKLAKAMGAHVVLFTTSPRKVEDGKRLGADEVVVSTNEEEMKKQGATFDLIIDAVSAQHDVDAYLKRLKLDGSLVLVGAPEHPLSVSAFNLLLPRRHFSGSAIGGVAETQEMLDFCAKKGIASDIEIIPMAKINEAWDRLLKQDVKYRFVIDMSTLKAS
jgi:alcohol dehydrogenase (NADP+)